MLSKVKENSLEVRLKGPSTTKYKDCVFSKIYQQISRRPDPNKFIKPFQKVHIDWFDLEKSWDDYQGDRRIIRRIVLMICETIGYALGYFITYPKEDENLPIVKKVVNWLQFRYDIKVRMVHSDGEINCIKTKRWLNCKDIDFERYILNTYE